MKTPDDIATSGAPRKSRHRGRWIVAGIVVVLIILLASLKSLAFIYTDSLWFTSINQHQVFSTLLAVKVGLFFSFGAAFFVMLWVNLVVCDRLGSSDIPTAPEDELVRRYQQVIRPFAGRVYIALAIVLALIAASGTVGQWQNWLLFRHGGSFGVTDPQFHKDVGFYVFKLPFINFVVTWALISLVVILIVSAVFHYLNGGINSQRVSPRVRPSVKAHLSVLLALIALLKAVGYVLARWDLANSTNGYVDGPGYTDVHARLPALTLLVGVSIFAALILLYNIRRQGWTLPVLAVGIWAFVALVVGFIYPAALQALKVTPAQSSLEAPYIQRNISATRAAYGLNDVSTHDFSGTASISSSTVNSATVTSTLANTRLWDPDPLIALQTFQKLQGLRSYYSFPSLGVDRYTVDGVSTPVLIGVRQINTNLPQSSWVNNHLQFTHGNAVALAQANQTTTSGNPVFSIKDVPPNSSHGLPEIKQPNVYFGLGESGYVVADSKQKEVNYQRPDGSNNESHYSGDGGVRIGSFLTRTAFALRLGDFNLWISDQVTNNSRIMFVRSPVTMAQKAAPFLSFDHDPYAVVNNGRIDWVVDAYTTTSQYPYSQNANTQQVTTTSTAQVPSSAQLPYSYNYVRNSVKVVIDAYTGKMTFYAMDQDPILKAYESAFPHMFTPVSKMSSELLAHLRYPEDEFSIQAAIYGRYHLTSPSAFYAASDSWQLSPSSGVSGPSSGVAQVTTYNQQGQPISTTPQRMAPLYQEMAVPGEKQQSFTISAAYVPASQTTTQNENLSGFLMGDSDPGQYGKLWLFQTPGQGVIGPANADSQIQANRTVSSTLSLLDQHGSSVLLGNTLMIPIGQSIVYVRPIYVTSSSNSLPQLQYVVAVFGNHVVMQSSLAAALGGVLGTPVNGLNGKQAVTAPSTSTSPGGSGANSTQVEDDIAAALTDYAAAQAALASGQPSALADYATNIQAMYAQLAAAQKLLQAANPASATTTTTTTAPAKSASKAPAATTTSTTDAKTTANSTTASAAGPMAKKSSHSPAN